MRILVSVQDPAIRRRVEAFVEEHPGARLEGSPPAGSGDLPPVRGLEDGADLVRVRVSRGRALEVARELGRVAGTAVVLLAPANGRVDAPDAAPAEAGAEVRESPYLERIAVEAGGSIRPVPVATIDRIVAAGPYAELHAGDRRHLVRESLTALEYRLDPREFMRVHRSIIVRLDRVVSYRRQPGGAGEVVLRGGNRVRVSRSRREALERWLGVRP